MVINQNSTVLIDGGMDPNFGSGFTLTVDGTLDTYTIDSNESFTTESGTTVTIGNTGNLIVAASDFGVSDVSTTVTDSFSGTVTSTGTITLMGLGIGTLDYTDYQTFLGSFFTANGGIDGTVALGGVNIDTTGTTLEAAGWDITPSLGLGYTLDLSENVEGHGVNAILRYKF